MKPITLREMAGALAIFAKYAPDGWLTPVHDYDNVLSEWEIATAPTVSEEDEKRLEKLGWKRNYERRAYATQDWFWRADAS